MAATISACSVILLHVLPLLSQHQHQLLLQQTVAFSMNCRGRNKAGLPCGLRAMSGFRYCRWHVPCCGVKRDGGRCDSRAEKEFGYLYCCQAHVPGRSLTNPKDCSKCGGYLSCRQAHTSIPGRPSTDPKVFRIGNLRRNVGQDVWKYRENKDAYNSTKKKSLISSMQPLELDHVLENHVTCNAYDLVKPVGIGFSRRKEKLIDLLKPVVNSVENLNFTTKPINQLKWRALYKFQQDYLTDTGYVGLGLVHYLKEATYGIGRLNRKTTAGIQAEIVKSYEHVVGNLQDEDQAQGQMIDLLNRNIVAMRLD